jgi:hypothetical protein
VQLCVPESLAGQHGRRDEGAGPATGLDGAGPGQAPPRLTHRGRADAELAGDDAHGGQARADRQVTRSDQPADSGSDAARAAVADCTPNQLDNFDDSETFGNS